MKESFIQDKQQHKKNEINNSVNTNCSYTNGNIIKTKNIKRIITSIQIIYNSVEK